MWLSSYTVLYFKLVSVYCSGWLIYRPSCHRCRRGKHCSTVLEAGADEGTFFLLSQTISCMCPKSHVLLCRSCFPSVACLPTTSSGWLSFLLWDSEVAKGLRYFLPYTNPEWIFGLHSNLMWLYVSWNVFSCKSFCDCLAAYEISSSEHPCMSLSPLPVIPFFGAWWT